MAGAEGFEPAHDGIKNRCLTTWLRPILEKGNNIRILLIFNRFYIFF